MTNKAISVILFFFFTFISFSQEKIKGNKIVTIIETDVNDFNKIIVGEKFNITLVKSDRPTVEIETDENLHDVIQFDVKDYTLTFKTTSKITSKKKLNIRVKYAQELLSIETKEDSDLSAVSTIMSDTLVLKTYGNSKASFYLESQKFKLINGEKSKVALNIKSSFIHLDLNENSKIEALIISDSLQVNLNRSATAEIEGDINYLNISAINSSNFKGKNLSAKTCDVLVQDTSDISIQVTESLTIEATEKSKLSLYGNPKIIINKFTDTAQLNKKEL